MYNEVFGCTKQRFLIERGAELWNLVKDNPRYAYYGTTVSLSDPQQDTSKILASLARLQGQGMCFYLPRTTAPSVQKRLARVGMRTATSLFYRGGRVAYESSKSLLTQRQMPSDLKMERLAPDSPLELVEATVQLCQSVGLSTMPGEIMRGAVLPGVCYVALNEIGEPVATASSYAMHTAGSPRESEAFWGVLATHEAYRGRGLAGFLGAKAIEYMWEEKGMRGFNTGIGADNKASQAACTKLGVVQTDWVTLFCFDDSVLTSLQC